MAYLVEKHYNVVAAAMIPEYWQPDGTMVKMPCHTKAEAAKLEAAANKEALTAALTVILKRNDPEDFKADGMPKQAKVVAEMDPKFARPTSTEISDSYAELQENIDLAGD